jgi:hypothetical protein
MKKNKIKTKIKTPAKLIPLKDIEYEDLFNQINRQHPINFKKYDLLNELHQQYPLISKEDLALVMKTLFEIIREKIIEGYKINVKYIFNEFHLIANKSFSGHPFLLLKSQTFPKIRKNVPHD